MSFQQQSVWFKTSFVLATIGFVVWLSAWESSIGFSYDSREQARIAFEIIGVIAYYGLVLLNFLYIFVEDTEGNPIVLIVAVALGILAGISGIIVCALSAVVPVSDRMIYATICAFVSAAVLLVSLISGGGGSGGGGGGSAAAHRSDFQPQQQVPA